MNKWSWDKPSDEESGYELLIFAIIVLVTIFWIIPKEKAQEVWRKFWFNAAAEVD